MASGRAKASSTSKYEINLLILLLVGVATLAFLRNSHTRMHSRVKQVNAELEEHCRENEDGSCGLEIQTFKVERESSLLNEEYLDQISRERSRNCSMHGFLDTDGDCQCSVIYKGTNCSKTYNFLVRLPGAWKMQATGDKVFSTRGFNGSYEKDLLMTQRSFPRALEKKHVYEPISRERYTSNRDGSVLRRREVIGFMDKAMYDVLPEEDPLGARVFNRCAVVGSSGILLNRLGGGIIDNYHLVMRFNSAPTGDFGRHVGSKTTFRIVNVNNMDYQEDDESLIVTGLSRDMLRDRSWFTRFSYGRKNKLLLLSPDFENYVAKSTVEFQASEGTVGALLALQVCRQVHLYGFHMWERHGSSPYHYYDTCTRAEGKDRDEGEDLEWKFLKSLVVGRLLSFGETCVLECRESESACDECRSNDPTYQQLVTGDLIRLRHEAEKPEGCIESDIDYLSQVPN